MKRKKNLVIIMEIRKYPQKIWTYRTFNQRAMLPDVYKASERFERLGVNFIKKPDDGKMKGLAFHNRP